MSAPIVGWDSVFVIVQLDRDGGIVKTLSAQFDTRRDAERVLKWKRRPGVALVQLVVSARVLTT